MDRWELQVRNMCQEVIIQLRLRGVDCALQTSVWLRRERRSTTNPLTCQLFAALSLSLENIPSRPRLQLQTGKAWSVWWHSARQHSHNRSGWEQTTCNIHFYSPKWDENGTILCKNRGIINIKNAVRPWYNHVRCCVRERSESVIYVWRIVIDKVGYKLTYLNTNHK